MAKHSKLSPSAAERWMNCPGSPALIGDDSAPAGDAAMKGTAAHRVIEVMIGTKRTDASKYLGKWVHVHSGDEDAVIVDSENAIVLKPGWFAFPIDDDMVYGVQIMVDYVYETVSKLFMPTVYTERYLDMSWLDKRLGGTADVSAVEPFGWIHLFDYKNGYWTVEVKGNPQMKNYAVGLLHEHPDCEGVVVHIVQPNAPHEDGIIRTITYTRAEMDKFAKELKAAADATSAPNAPRRAGDWCTWCAGKTKDCPEFDTLIQDEVCIDFANDPYENITGPHVVGGMTPEQLAQKARWIPLVDMWAREIERSIMANMLAGTPVPGWKIVQQKKHRKWIVPPKDVTEALEGLVDAEELFHPPELKSPAQVEKLGGRNVRKSVKNVVADLAMAPMGELVCAPVNDARDAVDPGMNAGDEFAEDPPEAIDEDMFS